MPLIDYANPNRFQKVAAWLIPLSGAAAVILIYVKSESAYGYTVHAQMRNPSLPSFDMSRNCCAGPLAAAF